VNIRDICVRTLYYITSIIPYIQIYINISITTVTGRDPSARVRYKYIQYVVNTTVNDYRGPLLPVARIVDPNPFLDHTYTCFYISGITLRMILYPRVQCRI
jgi:hypothetical protein